MKGILFGPTREYVGHNPASSYVTWAMLILLVGLIWTGIQMGSGNESVEELHEILAHSMLALVGIHVLGVILHTVRHRDPITLGMIDGRKRGPSSAAIRSARPISGLVVGVLMAAWAAGLWRGYDAQTNRVTLPIVGMTVALGESEEGAGAQRGAEHEEHEHRND